MKKNLTLSLIFLLSCSENIIHQDNASEFENAYKEISRFLDQVLIENIDKTAKDEFSKSFKYLKDIPNANLFERKKVYLFYQGLPSGGLWSKPGAKNFGGEKIESILFSNGPIAAEIVAHVELEGNRNYFYVLIDNEEKSEGWVGRPYVMKDKEGKSFLMPNPITGEKVREVIDVKLDINQFRKALIQTPTTYIQAYEKIPWHNCLCNYPEEMLIEAHKMYLDALEEGQNKVNSLIELYKIQNLSYH